MENLYLLKYNNYYNRIVKKSATIEDYELFKVGYTLFNTNFNPNDHLNTTQIVNWAYEEPDYVVVTDEDKNILSRWFVVAAERTRAKQLQLTLHRDIVVDYYDDIVTAPCFIEKATLDANDPGIFNAEDMTFNQILTTSTALMDETQSPWLVGYFAKNKNIENLTIKYEADLVPDYTADTIEKLPFYSLLNNKYTNYEDIAIDLIGKTAAGHFVCTNSFNENGAVDPPAYTIDYNNGFALVNTGMSGKGDYYDEIVKLGENTLLSVSLGNDINKLEPSTQYFTSFIKDSVNDWDVIKRQMRSYVGSTSETVSQYINKIAKVGNKYYKIVTSKVEPISDFNKPTTGLPNVEGAIRQAYNRAYPLYAQQYPERAATMTTEFTTQNITGYICSIRTIGATTATLILEEVTNIEFTATLTTDDNKVHPEDAPYDIFCMPYSDDVTLKVKKSDTIYSLKSNKVLAMATMNAIAANYGGSSTLYDIQLLPYCPVRNYIIGDKTLDLTQVSSLPSTKKPYYLIESSNIPIAAFIYCSKSSDTFNIEYNIPITDYKIQSQCDVYRLCSPNYASIFEFNAAKNRGVERFNVDFSYKPFVPYIHINPNFKSSGLYGQDNNEPRGLICGGDFSVSMINDQFATYELTNKNYQLSFQRQIENMEVNNSVQKEQEIWQAVSGTVGAGGIGAGAGMMALGPWGALVGVGTAGVSAAAGIRDIQLNEKLRQEALDYTKDQFGYQLGNIKALPHTIAKVTALNPNNKIFPVLEYYTCTEVEKQALRDKIRYNGMTVMRIGKIEDFLKPHKTYIKGKLIRIGEIDGDYHIVNAIANELNQGVFI